MALILGITVVPLGILLWMGSRLLEQHRDLESRQPEDRIVQAADALVASLQLALSSSEKRLAAGNKEWSEGAVAVTFRDGRIEVHPRERVAFLPTIPPLPEAPDAVFAEAEDFEFRKQDSTAANAILRELSKSSDPAIRAEASLRLGNSLSRSGRVVEALAAYDQITAVDTVAINRLPAGLIGLWARCDLLEKTRRSAELQAEAKQLASGLNSGRWNLEFPVYDLYAHDAARWSETETSGLRQPEVFAEATEALFERWLSLTGSSGQEPLTIGLENLTVLWQKSPDGVFRALIASPEFVEAQWLAAAAPVAEEHKISFRLGDTVVEEGRLSTKRSARETAFAAAFS